MFLTEDDLKSACDTGVAFIRRNNLLGVEFEVTGDYCDYMLWLKGRATVTREGNLLFPDGSVYYQEFDSDGNLIKETRPSGNVWTFEYEAGLLVKETGPLGSVFYEYDARGNKIKEVGTVVITYEYDEDNQLTKLTGARGDWLYTYKAGLLIKMTNPSGYTTYYEYDAKGNRTKDSTGLEHIYKYDESGRLIGADDAIITYK